MSLVNQVIITGSNKVGSELTAVLLNGASTSNLSYQWYRSSFYSSTYNPISGAVNSKYIIGLSDKYLKCIITSNNYPYESNIVAVDDKSSVIVEELSESEIQSIGRGLSIEDTVSSVSGTSQIISDISRINQSIKLILNTALGEVPMMPELGTNISQMLFSDVESFEDEVVGEIQSQLNRQEPRIDVTQVTVEQIEDDHIVHITIDYNIKNTNVSSQSIVEFGMDQGSV